MRIRPPGGQWCAAGVAVVLLGGCRQEAAPLSSVVDVPNAEAAPVAEYDRSHFQVRDSVSFVTAGCSYDLVVLSDTLEDTVGAMLWSGVRPVVLYERSSDQRRVILHNDSIVLAGDQGGILGDPYEGVEFRADTLRFFHYGGSSWRWAFTLEFTRESNGHWPLVRRTLVTYHALEPDSTMETRVMDMRPSGKHLGNWSSYQ